jgi:hypothetical protein
MTCGPVDVDVAANGGTLRFPECHPPPVGGSRGIGRSGRFFSPSPVLAARADNDDDEGARII